MNLYEVALQHSAPKDSVFATSHYFIGDNDEDVFDHIASEPETKQGKMFNSWNNREDGETFTIYDDKYNEIGEETFKDKIIRLKGEYNDDDYDYSDAYYGITLYGWELLKENVTDADFELLKSLGIEVYKK